MEQFNVIAIVACFSISLLVLLFYRQTVFQSPDRLQVKSLYIHPVKGIRGCTVDKAKIGPYGLEGDRTFCLQKVTRSPTSDELKFETMYIGYYLKLALFSTFLEEPGDDKSTSRNVIVTWTGDHHDESTEKSWTNSNNQIRFPLQPDLQGLRQIQVELHGSPTLAYDMGERFTEYFSRYLDCEVRLVYIGQNSRTVLGSIAPHSKAALSKSPFVSRVLARLPFIGRREERIVFNDIAQYLVVTEESNDQVSARLAEGYKMDVTKFRPNVVVCGSPKPFAEDYWAELTFAGGMRMALTANCYRCQSITVDYATGKTHEDDRGQVWKKLNKDRRIDKGAKYSPVFGRYGFCRDIDHGREICVGQDVFVTKKNATYTVFDWPGLTSFGTK
ncbi:hypothetical protein PV11_06126 [Exophiala sideris]|uniref:MOSC domain-containing protein n=1 Tax=Exophiala sideris TaxID=1016849 RepID=A0A0D1X8M4_9EURO|nr:hypothetical protein PV11_06126 [Exophiala sideris]